MVKYLNMLCAKKICLFLTFFLLIPSGTLAKTDKPALPPAYQQYLEYFYNRYSQHFDKIGLKYSAPDYGVKKISAPIAAREMISLASFYKFRAQKGEAKAKKIIKNQLIKALAQVKPRANLSFNDAEAFFLMVRLAEQIPNLLTLDETNELRQTLGQKILPGIDAADTENRAIVAAAHWQYLADYLAEKKIIGPEKKAELDKKIKEKVDAAIASSLSVAGWYREGEHLVPHYHAVSALMILVYGELTGQKEYLALAEKMYGNLKKLAFSNGLVEAQIGHRPAGLGAQFYLMAGILGQAANDPDYPVYLNYAWGSRFFSDPRYPNRLEYHRTAGSKTANYHDDYAFSDAAELLFILPPDFSARAIAPQTKIQNILNLTNDRELQIFSTGSAITIYDLAKNKKIDLKLLKNGLVSLTKKSLAAAASSANAKTFIGAPLSTPILSYAINQKNQLVLSGKNSDQVLPIASLTKLMTALVFMENRQKGWGETVAYDQNQHFVYGNFLKLKTGDVLRVKDIFYSLLVGSINEAAEMLISASTLSWEEFIKAMNKKAADWGLADTRYVDASGFSPKNVSTASEQLKVLQAAFAQPEIREALSSQAYEFDEVASADKKFHHYFLHTNFLLRQPQPYQILASKTGFLAEADKCLAMVLEKNNQMYFYIALKDPGYLKNTANLKRLLKNLAFYPSF